MIVKLTSILYVYPLFYMSILPKLCTSKKEDLSPTVHILRAVDTKTFTSRDIKIEQLFIKKLN